MYTFEPTAETMELRCAEHDAALTDSIADKRSNAKEAEDRAAAWVGVQVSDADSPTDDIKTRTCKELVRKTRQQLKEKREGRQAAEAKTDALIPEAIAAYRKLEDRRATMKRAVEARAAQASGKDDEMAPRALRAEECLAEQELEWAVNDHRTALHDVTNAALAEYRCPTRSDGLVRQAVDALVAAPSECTCGHKTKRAKVSE